MLLTNQSQIRRGRTSEVPVLEKIFKNKTLKEKAEFTATIDFLFLNTNTAAELKAFNILICELIRNDSEGSLKNAKKDSFEKGRKNLILSNYNYIDLIKKTLQFEGTQDIENIVLYKSITDDILTSIRKHNLSIKDKDIPAFQLYCSLYFYFVNDSSEKPMIPIEFGNAKEDLKIKIKKIKE